jgi:digeranylgeranylglycerophospholipid reductase
VASRNFDVIVVGAGPAGSAAALTAAAQGISVLLLEEHPRVGVPVSCAEGLSRSTIKGYLTIEPEWVSQELSGALVRSPRGDAFTIQYPGVGWVMNRKIFDPAIAKLARAQGAVLKTSAKAIGVDTNEIIVRESGMQKRYRFKFLIGADGVASHVGRWFGIDTRLSLQEIEVCAQYVLEDITIDPHRTALIFGEEYAPGGYAWIFPKSRNSANIGLGISPVRTDKPAKYFLDRWIKKEFPHGTIKAQMYGGVPAKILKQFFGNNFFLIGDAARLTDPLSGAGIANGIKSGVIAARNAVVRLKGKKCHFESEIKHEILDELKFHYRVRRAYLKLTDRDFNDIFQVGKKIYEGKTIHDINTRHLVKEILVSSPRLLKVGFNLLF